MAVSAPLPLGDRALDCLDSRVFLGLSFGQYSYLVLPLSTTLLLSYLKGTPGPPIFARSCLLSMLPVVGRHLTEYVHDTAIHELDGRSWAPNRPTLHLWFSFLSRTSTQAMASYSVHFPLSIFLSYFSRRLLRHMLFLI